MESESEIAKWYRGKSIFITGATGFMGKVLVEKLLRSCPEIGPIYVLVREKKDVVSRERVEDMLTSSLFNRIRKAGINPGDRLFAIPGDVALPDLGISVEHRRLLQESVSVVFHVAATVRFDEPLRLAVAMNLEGTKSVLELCQGMTKLSAVVHVSTAYANCNLSVVEERVYQPPTNPNKVMQLVGGLDDDCLDFVTARLINDHPNTYTFTKALAESFVSNYSTELPIVIVRPSIVSASWREPEPGWVDNFNGPTAMVVGISKGLMKSVYGRRHILADLIPVDVCINVFIAAAWEIGTRQSTKLPSEVLVYNCVSGPFNPITWNGFIRSMLPCTREYAMSNAFTDPDMTMTSSRVRHVLTNIICQSVPASIADFFAWFSGGKPKFRRYQAKLNHMFVLLEFFTTHEWHFRGDNIKRLNERLNPTDRVLFDFDVSKMNWKDYGVSYFLGIRRNVMKEEDSTIPAARKRVAGLRLGARVIKFGLLFSIGVHLYRYCNFSVDDLRTIDFASYFSKFSNFVKIS